jgi:hypothetical protein
MTVFENVAFDKYDRARLAKQSASPEYGHCCIELERRMFRIAYDLTILGSNDDITFRGLSIVDLRQLGMELIRLADEEAGNKDAKHK